MSNDFIPNADPLPDLYTTKDVVNIASNENSTLKLSKRLEASLSPALEEIIEVIVQKPGSQNSFYVELPDPYTIDVSKEQIATLVARASNIFSRMARYAGIARAEYKRAEGAYKRKHTASLKNNGKNPQERASLAIEACKEESEYMTLVASIVELAEAAEISARIASESARKLYDKIENINNGDRRYGAATEGMV